MCGYRAGTDIGGTFTELLALSEETREIVNIKIPSTPSHPADAVIIAFRQFLQTVRPKVVTTVSHPTTITVNGLPGQIGVAPCRSR